MTQIPITYIKTLVRDTVAIAEGQRVSAVYWCNATQLRKIKFPSNWTTCDVTFIEADTRDMADAGNMNDYNGPTKTPLLIPGVLPNDSIPLYAHWFDSVEYFQIICSVNQAQDVSVRLALQPIYQGIHN